MDKHYHHLHIARHTHFRHFLHNRYNDLVIADTLRHMALAMISLFIPIFLYKIGFSIFLIVILELVMCFMSVALHYVAVNLIPSWGVKKTLIISYALNIVLYVLLYQAEHILGHVDKFVFLGTIALFNVSATTIYWSAHHVYFFKTTTKENSGKKAGLIFSIPALAGIISPFLGAILISKFGFSVMFLVSSTLLLIAGGSLFFSKNIKIKKADLNIRRIVDAINIKKNLIYFIQGIGFHTISFFWPILMFLSAIKLVSIGFVYMFSSLAYSIIGLISGRITDKHGNRKIVTIGSIGFGFSIIFRSLASTISFITIWQTMGGVFGSLQHIPLEAGFYKFSSHSDYYNAIMNRELYMYLGRILVVVIFLIIILLAGISIIKALIAIMIFAGISTFTLVLIVKKDHSIIS